VATWLKPGVNVIKFLLVLATTLWLSSSLAQTPPPLRIAVLDLGNTPTGARVASAIRKDLLDKSRIVLIDENLATAAARGNGYQGSLNLSTEEARNIGAAIGCDFFIIGDAQTVARSPANSSNYFESYAAIFIVSARTGRLVDWERWSERHDAADGAEKALLKGLMGPDAITGFRQAIFQAFAGEAAERAAAVETPPAAIEVMSDEDNGKSDTRAPRPYRRVKPPYPPIAAQNEIEATVDVLVDIDARGEISHLEIARWAGYKLDQSVLDTVRQMHFFPAMRDGVAIPMRVLLRYNFQQKAPEKPAPKPLKLPAKISPVTVQTNQVTV